jgi:hypothetical protein
MKTISKVGRTKVYEMVAETLAAQRPPDTSTVKARWLREQWASIVGEFSERFAADNPNFDPERFMRACAA